MSGTRGGSPMQGRWGGGHGNTGEMLSRLSGLANVVLHELSGDDTDENMRASLDPEIPQESNMELNNRTQEDAMERLAYTEQMVVELKEMIRQKDIELQQKDEILQEERKAADNKIKKLKLHAKAKLTSLNKHIEEMKAQGGTISPTEPHSEEQHSKHDKSSTEEELEAEKIKLKLQEKEELISSLQAQLIQAQTEQAKQFDKSSTEMEEFETIKQQLQEKEEIIGTLQAQLSQIQAEQVAQLSSMQQVVREKDARFETQVRLHEDELLQLVTQAEVEAEMQQKLRVLQRKLEEHEEALLGRAQVVDLLQQELTAAEQKNQVLSQQLQQIEMEHNALKNTVETERQESKILMEKMELEVAERKLSFHNLQGEMHHLLEQLEQAGQAKAELQFRYSALEQKYKVEMEDKTSYIVRLRKTEQELHSACDTLKDENSKLLQNQSEQAVNSAQTIQELEDQLQKKCEELSQFLNKPNLSKDETASQTSFPDVYNEGSQADTEEKIAFLQKRVIELENEKGALLLSSVKLEELKAENEKLSSQITLLEAHTRSGEADREFSEISMIDQLDKRSFYGEESQQDVLDKTFSQKHKELSVLLLEMKEAQEEIAFLKSQLRGSRAEGSPEVLGDKEMKPVESEGIAPDGMKILLEDTGQHLSPMPNEGNSLPTIETEEQMSTKQLNKVSKEMSLCDTEMESKSTKQDNADKPSSDVPDICQCHQDELERLKGQILELETNFNTAEKTYEKNIDEKVMEISNLTHLIEEFKKNAENSSSAFTALSEERERLLSQVKELSVVAELKAQVKQLEVSLEEVEKQRRLDYEGQTTQQNLLTEQIHSLSIEAKSKDVKIEVLQNELDDVQLQFSEQSTLIKGLQSQLQEKESEVLEGAERVRDISNKMEELSQTLSQKESEIVKINQLLLERKRDMETLQKTIEEKNQQVTEISFSMTEKMVQLNEEKFSLGVEIKTLKEQLNVLSRAEEAKKEQTDEDKVVVSDIKQNYELNPAGVISKEELQHELDLVKKENEQRKRKLQAALINRKELLQKVSRLEEELAKVKDESNNETSFSDNEKKEMQENKESKEDLEKCVTSKCQEVEISLRQAIAEKEAELEHVRKDLKEKIAVEEQFQAMLQQMNHNLQEKTSQIDLLQSEITENQAIIQKLTTGNKDAGDGNSAAPVKETVAVSSPKAGSGEQQQPELEAKIMDLEKEKDQLQKKLQEMSNSRKVILKKAQEKEKHLREELKQQKDDYNHLQEQFDVQRKENKNIEDELRHLQILIREFASEKLQSPNQQEPCSPTQGLEEPLFKATEQQPVAESNLNQPWPSYPEDANTFQASAFIAQINTQLKELDFKKKELELKVGSTASELTKKSEELHYLQDQLSKQNLEIQNLKMASHEAEAHTESLRQKLEKCQLKIDGLEHLRELQPELDELQKVVSKKEEEVRYLSGQVGEKEACLTRMQTEITEQVDLIKALHTQLEMQAKEHDKKLKQLQVELCEMKQKPEEAEEESKAKQQIQRKLQAALVSRKEALKEKKVLQEELSLARDTIEQLTKSLGHVESQVSAQNKEKDTVLAKLVLLQEERDKLITEMDKSLLENQSLTGSCESLKLALMGLTEDKENLVKEMETLQCSKIAENTEWEEKHKELQKEYEILLQSYENVSNEAERIQHVVETVRQEKQELYGKLRSTEGSKKEAEKQLQEAEQEMEEMKEKMRKFAKSKQQKILELEEENDRLRAEVHPAGGTPKDCIEALSSSNYSLKEELDKVKTEYETLSKDFEAILIEKDVLSEEVQVLKHQIEGNIPKQVSLEKQDNQVDTIEKATQYAPDEANEQDSVNMSARLDYSESIPSENSAMPDVSENVNSHDEINNYLHQIDQFKERIAELEEQKEKEKEFSQTLENERNTLLSQISAKDDNLKVLQEELNKIKQLNQQIQEELTRITKLKETAEEEKDDLEERLMNQLAELNGSIGNYYQDVTDAQIKIELLESEMQNLKKYVSELEEEKQQLVKEKTQVESEIRKEYLEKLKGAEKGPSNKSHAKELQELLKEKQQEVKQLQKDCIRYQEKISALERTVKALEFIQSESQKDLEITKRNLAQANEHRKKAETELASFKVLLDDTQSEAARVLADNAKLKKELQSNKESVKNQMRQKDEDLERRLEQVEEKHLKEKKNVQEKLDALHREKVHLEETFGEIEITLNKKDKEVKQLQENLDSTVAQLAAFTKSMSSLQDDRDRVIDEAKKWEKKFSDAIQTKEDEVRLKEENCIVLKDQLRQMSIHMEELKINISRLEHDKQSWEHRAQSEVQRQQKVCDTLQGENKELLSQLEESQHLYHNSQNELAKLESELKIFRDQSTDLNNSLEEIKEKKENLEGIIKQQEADIQNYKFSNEQLETDLQNSKQLTSRLREEINMKEQKIMGLLSAREQALQVVVAEMHAQRDKEIQELENLLSQEEEENIVLEEENKKVVHKTNQLVKSLKSIKKENVQQKAQLNSFVKSMSSLQDDRDRIVGDYQKLEERHLSVILEKDQLIQDAANENNKLKEEIRCLRSHMDDLNSENAKLNAELIQYREDLKQVISRKDCQQKQLLEAQLQQTNELKNECAKLEEKLKESAETKEDLQRSSITLQEEKQSLSKEIESLQITISQLKRQVAALQEEDSLGVLQAQLKVKEEEAQKLSTALSSSQKRIVELEEELVQVQKEAAKNVGEVEDKLKKELKHLHHDAGIMRNETETAEERVAELARDLMEMEQKLLMVTKENKDLTAQIQSFGRSMNSLQNSRDNANEELDELKRKYNISMRELAQLKEQQGLLNRECDVLVSKASFPTNSNEGNSQLHLEKFSQQLLSKDEQLLHLSSQLEDAHNQLQTFSKAMASLQNERDHLLNELHKFRKSDEGKQKSVTQPVTSPAELQSLKKAMSSLQNDRDRLLKELKNLQQQYLQINKEVTELRPLKAQLQESQDKTKTFQIMQEELRQEHLSWQHELHQLRMEKGSWEIHERRMKEQYLMAITDKDQQLSHLRNLIRELSSASSQSDTLNKVQYQRQASPETSASQDRSQNLVYETDLLRTQLNNTLKEVHQKELRIQQLNSKFSQLLEEKNTLSIQLCDTSQSLRENQQHYSDLFNHCAVLEKQVQELQAGPLITDVAPGAPQEKNGTHRKDDLDEQREAQLSFSEAQKQLYNTKQEMNELRKLLEEERDQRATAENALSVAEEQIRRLEHGEWDSARTPIIGSCGTQEQALLIDLTSSSCRQTRSGVGWKRVLRSLCHSRTRVPLLAAIYFLMVHVLLILCFTGHL
ncbi:golgin subfamily B member 1 [Erinaceus europaeus]|uniref:Golgin subfamily B member 1 n=1 Tax=Erinaceus europaeus TaxID=9365 RepID=A0ABM3XZN8_ERIEU|nr:golgin subfamily B member 1 [Erinaceus europaeus]